MTGAGSTTATTTWRTIRRQGGLRPPLRLVARERVFDREQLEGLRQAVQGFLYGEGPASYHQELQCRRLLDQITAQLPEEPRIRCRAKVRSLDSPYEGVPNQAPLFSIQKLLVSLGLRHFFRYVW